MLLPKSVILKQSYKKKLIHQGAKVANLFSVKIGDDWRALNRNFETKWLIKFLT